MPTKTVPDIGEYDKEDVPEEAFKESKGNSIRVAPNLSNSVINKTDTSNAAADALRSLFNPTSTNETQAKAELMKTLFDKKNIKMVTDIQPYEMAAIMSMSAISGTIKNSLVLSNFIQDFEQYKISYMRKGRQEGLVIATPPQPSISQGQMGFMQGLRNSIFPSGDVP